MGAMEMGPVGAGLGGILQWMGELGECWDGELGWYGCVSRRDGDGDFDGAGLWERGEWHDVCFWGGGGWFPGGGGDVRVVRGKRDGGWCEGGRVREGWVEGWCEGGG